MPSDFASLLDWLIAAMVICIAVMLVLVYALCRASGQWSRYEEEQETDARRFNADNARAFARRTK